MEKISSARLNLAAKLIFAMPKNNSPVPKHAGSLRGQSPAD
jgi:hypothetical protein